MYVTELFKEFQENRIKQAKKSEIDYMKEVYANTELFDFSKLVIEEQYYNIGQVENRWVFPNSFDALPFLSQFIKISNEFCIMLKEYQPTILTGCIFLNYKSFQLFLPFTFHINTHLLVIQNSLIDLLKNTFGYRDAQVLINSSMQMLAHVFEILDSLSKYALVVDKNEKAKPEYYAFRDKSKKTIKVTNRPIYYILNKKDVEKKTYNIQPLGKLEYSHAFKVRGHWRKIDEKSIGKDRNGDYKIEGFTWVTDYVKGEGELVNRVRIVK